ncbi:ArsR/SmtB family transcription factor [Desulforamulus ruminis]|uniref:Regulatory protein ArsR n=1 Tax=Desulforamulus ruminis (strain ATCC 23193 / DSM 2154 / NCIMB 8452 / DL) TaxID=696281 RepID=F6DKJ6_DESRL|nr:metalloregulator ArsR/SmtB family transcription factor [Desulforamulus ruminis]AEG59256.1 regulatory protein ArsR [Desulforamulus ruminis DSM 2154]
MAQVHKFEAPAELLKALAHPTRLCIVEGLMGGQCNVSKIQACLDIPQSTVSQQLSILRAKGIIEGRRQGTEVVYSVVNEKVKKIVRVLLEDPEGV